MYKNQAFVINTIHELRNGVDMLKHQLERGTVYANPDVTEEDRLRAMVGGCQIRS